MSFPPNVVACAAIYIAGKVLNYPFPSEPQTKEWLPWWKIFGASLEDIEYVAASILELYTTSFAKDVTWDYVETVTKAFAVSEQAQEAPQVPEPKVDVVQQPVIPKAEPPPSKVERMRPPSRERPPPVVRQERRRSREHHKHSDKHHKRHRHRSSSSPSSSSPDRSKRHAKKRDHHRRRRSSSSSRSDRRRRDEKRRHKKRRHSSSSPSSNRSSSLD